MPPPRPRTLEKGKTRTQGSGNLDPRRSALPRPADVDGENANALPDRHPDDHQLRLHCEGTARARASSFDTVGASRGIPPDPYAMAPNVKWLAGDTVLWRMYVFAWLWGAVWPNTLAAGEIDLP